MRAQFRAATAHVLTLAPKEFEGAGIVDGTVRIEEIGGCLSGREILFPGVQDRARTRQALGTAAADLRWRQAPASKGATGSSSG